jgi:hypothetical protein
VERSSRMDRGVPGRGRRSGAVAYKPVPDLFASSSGFDGER